MCVKEFRHPVLKQCNSILLAPISAHPAPYLIRFAPPAFTPHRRARSGGPPSPFTKSVVINRRRSGGLPRIKGFYPYTRSTVRLSRLLVLQYPLRASR